MTGLVGSLASMVVGTRFPKRQQIPCSRSAARSMLQTRTRVLDGTLRAEFQSWYPGLFSSVDTNRDMKKAAV